MTYYSKEYDNYCDFCGEDLMDNFGSKCEACLMKTCKKCKSELKVRKVGFEWLCKECNKEEEEKINKLMKGNKKS